MRFGIKFLALTGLCGFVLSCLIGLAEDGPAPELAGGDFVALPPEQTEPAADQPPVKYSRNRDQSVPAGDDFSKFAAGEQPGPGPLPSTGSVPFFPLGQEPPPEQAPDLSEDLIHVQYQASDAAPKMPPVVLFEQPDESEPAPFPGTSPSFPQTAVPHSEGNPTEFNPLEPIPASVENVKVEALVPEPVSPETVSPEPVLNVNVEPTTGPQSAVVTLEWVKRTEVNVGQECQCDLLVKNAGESPARSVSVRASFPALARLLPATTPAPATEGNLLKWQLGDLAPGQAKTIAIHMIPTSRGDLNASAFVQFTSAAAAAFPVQEPLLEVALQGPKEVQLGDPASQIIQVSNPGTGTARNVEIKALIPTGLEHPQGKQLTMTIGSLNPGETRMVRLALSAVSGGKQQIKVLAEARLSPKAAPYLRKVSETDIQIISPSVKVIVDGPGLRYKNRNATYNINVVNDGTAISNNVRVMHSVPDGFKFVSANEGGKYDALSKTVAWFVGRIEPGQSSEMTVTLEAVQLGDFVHAVSAMTDQGARSEDQMPTRVEGIPSLALEVKDLNDPVEIGVETAYEIHVKNQGTKHAQNVAVACELPAGVESVDVNAPTPYNMQGRVVVFQALPTLDAEKTAVFRIIVKGQADGYQRFRARLASDSIQEPLLVEELTKFYGE